MNGCLNTSSSEFQTLLKKSGLKEQILVYFCRGFINKNGRFPKLDEIPGSDYKNYLKNNLKLNELNATSLQTLLQQTGTNTYQEAEIALNKDFGNRLNIDILPLGKSRVIVDTNSKYDNSIPVLNPSTIVGFRGMLNKLSSKLGIEFNLITDKELVSNPEFSNFITDDKNINAFIYKGQIYINLDHAQLDAPIHELSHLFLGSLRYSNPEIYYKLVDFATKLPNYQQLVEQYPNRTISDINEEIFVTEFSKYLAGLNSEFNEVPNNIISEITYNIKKILSYGYDKTIKDIKTPLLMKLSLKDIYKKISNSDDIGYYFNLSDAETHRITSNLKSELLKKNELKEECE